VVAGSWFLILSRETPWMSKDYQQTLGLAHARMRSFLPWQIIVLLIHVSAFVYTNTSPGMGFKLRLLRELRSGGGTTDGL
jgi:hypothetical protein